MTTVAPGRGTAPALVLDADLPEVELRPLWRGDAAALRAVFAVMGVVDAWQRRGVGALLLAALTPRAGELGARRVNADVASHNVAVLRMLRRTRAGWSLMHAGRGGSRLVLALDGVPA